MSFANNGIWLVGEAQAGWDALTNAVVASNDARGSGASDWLNYPTRFGKPSARDRNKNPTDQNGIVSVDPHFVDAAVDFHLRKDSTPLDVGAAIHAPLLDLDGNDRYGFPDMGCYEFSTVSLELTSAPRNGQVPAPIEGSRGIPLRIDVGQNLRDWTHWGIDILSNRVSTISLLAPIGVSGNFYRLRPVSNVN